MKNNRDGSSMIWWGGGALVPTAELCRSCVPPAHQLLHLNLNCCSQFTYHHVITQITVSHFVFFALSPPPAPPLARARGCTPPSISIPDVIYIYKRLFIFSLWGGGGVWCNLVCTPETLVWPIPLYPYFPVTHPRRVIFFRWTCPPYRERNLFFNPLSCRASPLVSKIVWH
jgi:hypothetical protein